MRLIGLVSQFFKTAGVFEIVEDTSDAGWDLKWHLHRAPLSLYDGDEQDLHFIKMREGGWVARTQLF